MQHNHKVRHNIYCQKDDRNKCYSHLACSEPEVLDSLKTSWSPGSHVIDQNINIGCGHEATNALDTEAAKPLNTIR